MGWVQSLEVPAEPSHWYRRVRLVGPDPFGDVVRGRPGGRQGARDPGYHVSMEPSSPGRRRSRAPRAPADASAFDGRPGRRGPVRARAARPADLGHRPVQLPLPVLHAGRGLRARLRVPAPRPGADVRGDRAARAGLRRPRGRQAPDHRRRAAGPAGPAGARSRALGDPGSGRRAGRPHAHDQRLRAPAAGRAPGARRAAADHGERGLARRRHGPRDERRGLPDRQGARRDRGGAGGGPRADQGQHGRPPRASTRRRSCRSPAGRATRA